MAKEQDENMPRHVVRESWLPEAVASVASIATGVWLFIKEKEKLLDKEIKNITRRAASENAPPFSEDFAVIQDFSTEVRKAVIDPARLTELNPSAKIRRYIDKLKEVTKANPSPQVTESKEYQNYLNKCIQAQFPERFGFSHIHPQDRFDILFKSIGIAVAVGAIIFYSSKILSQKGAQDKNYYYVKKEENRRRQHPDKTQPQETGRSA